MSENTFMKFISLYICTCIFFKKRSWIYQYTEIVHTEPCSVVSVTAVFRGPGLPLLWDLGKQGCPLISIQSLVVQRWHLARVFWLNVKMAKAGSRTTECLLVTFFFFLFFLFSVFAMAFPCQRKDFFFVGIKSVLKYDTMYLPGGRHCPGGKEWAGPVLCVPLPHFRWEHTVSIPLLLMRQLAAFLRPTETWRRCSLLCHLGSEFFLQRLPPTCLSLVLGPECPLIPYCAVPSLAA